MAEKAKIETLPSAADIYLFHEGTNYRSYSMLGAHTAAEEGVTGGALYRVGSSCDICRTSW